MTNTIAVQSHFSCKASKVRMHQLRLLSIDHLLDVGNHLTRVVILDGGRPTRSNTIRSIHQHHGNDGHIVLRLNGKTVIVEVV